MKLSEEQDYLWRVVNGSDMLDKLGIVQIVERGGLLVESRERFRHVRQVRHLPNCTKSRITRGGS